jgi:pyrimidine operon attenuation protein/uracil phosphoribosyltransferase
MTKREVLQLVDDMVKGGSSIRAAMRSLLDLPHFYYKKWNPG